MRDINTFHPINFLKRKPSAKLLLRKQSKLLLTFPKTHTRISQIHKMSNTGYCGCKLEHPAPRRWLRCTKTPNSHVPCLTTHIGTAVPRPCGRALESHTIEDVHPASSSDRVHNCPNHRDLGEYWQNGVLIKPMRTGFLNPSERQGELGF